MTRLSCLHPTLGSCYTLSCLLSSGNTPARSRLITLRARSSSSFYRQHILKHDEELICDHPRHLRRRHSSSCLLVDHVRFPHIAGRTRRSQAILTDRVPRRGPSARSRSATSVNLAIGAAQRGPTTHRPSCSSPARLSA